MKNLLLFLFFILLAFSCKKKKDEPTPEPSAPATKDISLKVDGVDLNCSDCSYSWLSGSRGITFDFPDSDDLILLNFYLRPVPGNYALVKGNNTYKNYVTLSIKKDGTYYPAITGSIQVTQSDTTSEGTIKRMVAGLNFKTDTINGRSLIVTDGTIDFTKK